MLDGYTTWFNMNHHRVCSGNSSQNHLLLNDISWLQMIAINDYTHVSSLWFEIKKSSDIHAYFTILSVCGFTAFCWFVPHCSHSYHPINCKLPVQVQQPQVPLHTYHTHYHIPTTSISSGAANVKAVVPTILHLQTQDKCKHSTTIFFFNIHGSVHRSMTQ